MRKVWRTVALACALFPGVALADTRMAEAVKLRAQGDLPAALALLRPNGVDPERERLFEYAITLSWADRLPEALATLDSVLAIDAHWTAARVAKARVLNWLGEHAAARTLLEDILHADPTNREARLCLIDVAISETHFSEARARCSCLLSADPNDQDARAALARIEGDYRTELEALGGGSLTDVWRPVGSARASVRLDGHWTALAGYRADAIAQPIQTGAQIAGSTQAMDVGVKTNVSRRVVASFGYGVLIAPSLLAHGPLLELSVRWTKAFASTASLAPTLRTGLQGGLLWSVGAQLIAREGYVLAQVFRYDETRGGYASAFALSGETPHLFDRLSLRAGASVALLPSGTLMTTWAEPRLRTSSHIELFARAERNFVFFERTLVGLGIQVRI
jgi:Tetratricopeptide repeat